MRYTELPSHARRVIFACFAAAKYSGVSTTGCTHKPVRDSRSNAKPLTTSLTYYCSSVREQPEVASAVRSFAGQFRPAEKNDGTLVIRSC